MKIHGLIFTGLRHKSKECLVCDLRPCPVAPMAQLRETEPPSLSEVTLMLQEHEAGASPSLAKRGAISV